MRNKFLLTFIVFSLSVAIGLSGCGKEENVSSGNRPNHGNEGTNIGKDNSEEFDSGETTTEEVVQVEKIETLVLKQKTQNYKKCVYTYDENGLIIKAVYYASDGSYSEAEAYRYDKNGNLIEKVYMSGSELTMREEYAYDTKGRVVKKTEEEYVGKNSHGYTYTYEYDEQDRVVKKHSEPFNLSDERARTIEYAYDEAGRLVREGGYTYTYEEQAQAEDIRMVICRKYSESKKYVDGNAYVYNNAGQLVQELMGGKEDGSYYKKCYHYEYDSNGNVIKVTEDKKVVQTMTYETMLVNSTYVYKEITVPDLQEKTLAAGGYIPLGGIYYVKQTGEVLIYLDKFPAKPASGDVYAEQSYEYKFNSAGEMSVKVKEKGYSGRKEYAPLKESVMGVPLTSMFKTFENCKSMVKSPEIPKTVTSMSGTFHNCNDLKEAPVIPEGVTDISHIFYNCVSMEKATQLPEGITNMSWAFYNCEKLVELPQIPSTVVAMSGAFKRCLAAVSAPTIPESVTQMDSAFASCVSLTGTVEINAQLKDAGYESYKKCFEGIYLTQQNITLTGSCPYLKEIEATSYR